MLTIHGPPLKKDLAQTYSNPQHGLISLTCLHLAPHPSYPLHDKMQRSCQSLVVQDIY